MDIHRNKNSSQYLYEFLNNGYFEDDESPKYKKHKQKLVVFLDVLGISEMIRNPNYSSGDLISEMINLRKYVITWVDKLNVRPYANVLAVSDCVIIVCDPLKHKELSTILAKVQSYCLLREDPLLLRGAIDCGEISVEDNGQQIIGPAYLNAYELQENVAIYPRIIISGTAATIMDTESRASACDNVPFLDFMKILKEKGENVIDDLTKNNTLNKLKEKRDRYSSTKSKDLRVRKKFEWMIKYLIKRGVSNGE